MATIEIKFTFLKGDETFESIHEFFVDSGIEYEIDSHKDDLQDELGGDWDFDEFSIESYDEDFAHPKDFNTLDDYGAYVSLCEEFGEAYKLRFEDLGSLTQREFEDYYIGCWDSEEEFAKDNCDDIPDRLYNYIDWEAYAKDLMYDYSSYEGDDGFHIFRD